MPRIIMVADTFDAMTTNRPTRRRWTPNTWSVSSIPWPAPSLIRLWLRHDKIFETGKLRIHRAATVTGQEAAAAAVGASSKAKKTAFRLPL